MWAALKGLSPAQFQFKAAPDPWPVADCLTGTAPKPPAQTEAIEPRKANDAKLLAARRQKARAPEPLKPGSKFASPKEALTAFIKARQKTIAFVKTTDADLRALVAPHPVCKEADAYQWLLLIAGHPGRHTQQILEVKADPNFPKK